MHIFKFLKHQKILIKKNLKFFQISLLLKSKNLKLLILKAVFFNKKSLIFYFTANEIDSSMIKDIIPYS